MNELRKYSGFIALITFFTILSCLYQVDQGQNALLLKLGKIVNDRHTHKPMIVQAGLHTKWPMIEEPLYFDTRLQTLLVESSRIVTEEKKDVLVDYYVKWRISDLPLYYTRTGGNQNRTETLLRQKLNDGLRAEFGKRKITEVVSGERSGIMEILQKEADRSAQSLGVRIVDVRIKSIDLPEEVSAAVFERMRAERERIATQHRADGRAQAEGIRAEADKFVTVALAKANGQAKQIMGRGDAVAAKIYSDAYSQDAGFYAFYRSIAAYKESFANKNDVLLLQPDMPFFKYFNTVSGALEAQPKAK